MNVYEQARLYYNAARAADSTAEQRRQAARTWRYLQARQAAELVKHARASIRARLWVQGRTCAVGAVLCVTSLGNRRPPKVRPWRLRFTHPALLPGMDILAFSERGRGTRRTRSVAVAAGAGCAAGAATAGMELTRRSLEPGVGLAR